MITLLSLSAWQAQKSLKNVNFERTQKSDCLPGSLDVKEREFWLKRAQISDKRNSSRLRLWRIAQIKKRGFIK
ncbi:MAG TPA: hypothetical protein PLW39_12110 [Thermoflexales bacterium]|nr:hypothetical protein [Thermoflexales bacterium]HQW35874.1 hypothetical protein [Thermoflexales bacterium]HQZ23001.1 hypothetical protein [Thermoflexales bacterium]